MQSQDFLLEIGCEELPAKILKQLITALANNIAQGLHNANLQFSSLEKYATPRRLAILIKNLVPYQPERKVSRKGPAINAAFNADGKPTPALEGFARSCNTTIDKLSQETNKQGAWFVYEFTESGAHIKDLLPQIITQALKQLPIPKPMRWGNATIEFLRPVHWIIALYGNEIIPCSILSITADNKTRGHRFISEKSIILKNADSYLTQLKEQGKVIANYEERQASIVEQIKKLAAQQQGQPYETPELLDEVTGLVEWPVAILCKFDKDFLKIPHEALIAAMVEHQKSFPIKNTAGELLPYFITIANLDSKDPQEVVKGNERVMRARLSDAKFFFEEDCKIHLATQVEKLKTILFQAKLGSLFEKTDRLQKIVAKLVDKTDKKIAERAAYLCKADLVSQMVGEFPELQGIMGCYYAKNDKEDSAVAEAIREHYLPRFATDILPHSLPGSLLAIADRIDSIVGIFGINQLPTGDKDPYGLRRAASGILKIIIEREIPIDLLTLIMDVQANFSDKISNPNITADVHQFILDRLPAYYQEKNIAPDTLNAVLAVQNRIPLDIDRRVRAVQMFRSLAEANALASANKRVSNILKNNSLLDQAEPLKNIKANLFENEIENTLFQAITQKQQEKFIDYQHHLTQLAQLREPIDLFFDKVLVMHEDEKIRLNRLALLASLRKLFLEVADISLLQS